MTKVDLAKKVLLRKLYADFRGRNLSAADLENGYEGLAISSLRPNVNTVDFDLALKQLEEAKLVDTGPKVPYENKPGDGILMLGLYSKREYVYLTELGYQRAQDPDKHKNTSVQKTTFNIHGSQIHHSNIGTKTNVRQTNINQADTEVIEKLLDVIREERDVSRQDRKDVEELISYIKQDNLDKAKSLSQKVFGVLGDGAKKIAWGLLGELLKKALLG